MKVLVTSCPKYYSILPAYAHQFIKYWGQDQEVVVLGFEPLPFVLPPNFGFLSLGNVADYPVTKWSDALIKAFTILDDDVFCLMLDDYLLTRPVNVGAVQMLYQYMRQFLYVIKMDLCADRLYAWGIDDYGYCGYIDLVRSHPGSQYHMSLMTGLWNRKNLLRILKSGESPWDVELQGTPRLAAMTNMLVLGTRIWPVRHILAYRGGDSNHLNLDGLHPEDVAELKELGYLPKETP